MAFASIQLNGLLLACTQAHSQCCNHKLCVYNSNAMCVYVCMCIYIYIYTHREREREREREMKPL